MDKKYRNNKVFFIILFTTSILSLVYFLIRWNSWTWLQNIMGISGLLAVVLMTWQLILWVRVVSASWIKDFFRVNAWHKWLGMATVILILLHPFITEIVYAQQWLWELVENGPINSFVMRINIWNISRILLFIVLISSVLLRTKIKNIFLRLFDRWLQYAWENKKIDSLLQIIKKIFSSYRIWYLLHLLAYIAIVWVWFHAWFTGTKINTVPAVHLYRIILWIIIVATWILRILQALWLLQVHGEVIWNNTLTSDVYEITLQLSKWINYFPGQFVYLQFQKFWEAHPFTVVTYDKNSNILTLAYKVIGKFTTKLATIKQWDITYIDWPYGVFTSDIQKDWNPVYCIAWWIGITPFYHLIASNIDWIVNLIYLNKTFSESVYINALDRHLWSHLTNIFSRENKEILIQT